MADRMRQIMKNSGSKLSLKKGSVSHIGAAPYRFRLDVLISHVENIANVSEVCVTWERRGHTEATPVAKVAAARAVFRHTLTMNVTLFRRSNPAENDQQHQLKFDQKKAKFQLRKAAPDGKVVGKLTLDLAHYVRGINSTVFADMKLSNGAVIATKIEANMLHVGKKKKGGGSRADSDACSEMTDVDSCVDNDSLFGDDDADLGDLEIETTPPPPGFETSPVSSNAPSSNSLLHPSSSSAAPLVRNSPLPKTSATPEKGRRSVEKESERKNSGKAASLKYSTSKRGKKTPKDALKEEDGLENSPSLRDKIKGKMKGKKDKDKEKEKDLDKEKRKEKDKNTKKDLAASSSKSTFSAKSNQQNPPSLSHSPQHAAEIAELKSTIARLKKENAKLTKSTQSAMEEIEALREDLRMSEMALEQAQAPGTGQYSQGAKSPRALPKLDASKALKDRDTKIAELTAQNDALLEELEELHEGAVDSAVGVASGQINALKKEIEELEIALKREPQYMDVVNELKVTKVSLALANMEKEQALFALQSHNVQQQRYYSSDDE